MVHESCGAEWSHVYQTVPVKFRTYSLEKGGVVLRLAPSPDGSGVIVSLGRDSILLDLGQLRSVKEALVIIKDDLQKLDGL